MHPYLKAIRESEVIAPVVNRAMGGVALATASGYAWGRGFGPWWVWAFVTCLLASAVEQPLRATVKKAQRFLTDRHADGFTNLN